SSRRRHTRSYGDWSSDVCSSDLEIVLRARVQRGRRLVEDHERRIAEERARERDTLPLADGDVLASHEHGSEHGVVAVGPALDEQIGRASCRERVESPDVALAWKR